MVILSKCSIFLDFYLKNGQNLGFFGSKSEKISKNLEILKFFEKKINLGLKFVKFGQSNIFSR